MATPITADGTDTLSSSLDYYLDGTQTPSATPDQLAFSRSPPPQLSPKIYNVNGDLYDEQEQEGYSAFPSEEEIEALRASGRPTIVISDEALNSTPGLLTAATPAETPLSPFQKYRGWLSAVVAPLEEFIDEAVDPRDHYLDLREIAEGESGSVYAATLNPDTAHKLRLPPLVKAKDNDDIVNRRITLVAIKSVAIVPAGSPKLVDLQRELSLMKGLGHENVLGMDGVYVDLVEDSLWVRMELMERSLADIVGLIGGGFMLQDRMIARFASDVLHALVFLQEHNIVHRDVRSDNLLLNKHGVLKLADFSNAIQVTKENPNRAENVGVVFWQAPEVRRHAGFRSYLPPPYNALKVDVWSLGATVWEMAQTQPPFYDTGVLADHWPPVDQPSLYSPAFHDFLRKTSEPASSRPRPMDLMKHSFINNACGRLVIVQLLSQCLNIESQQSEEES
ncbi:kinase-like domain-containing protein [Panaeolus papilionaceus]|nr:kinase-like domain-containing protein [Panaeolus papilionaceus]